jgi:ABC-type branched-subunit amino acid transport system permease subunit
LFESWFYLILEWLLQLVCWDHFLRKLFSNLLLWGSDCLYYWGVLPLCSKRLSPVYLFSLLVYVFLRQLSPLILRNIKEKWLLLIAIFVVRGGISFLCGYLLLGLLKDYFLVFFQGVVSVLMLVLSICYPWKGWFYRKILCKFVL